MSVPTWKRSESPTEYLYQIYLFTILKKRIRLTETGEVVIKPARENFKRRRRNLKTQRRLLDEGKMTMAQVQQSYNTWRSYAKQNGAANKSIESMDRLYYDLFGEEKENGRRNIKCIKDNAGTDQ